MLNHQLDSFQMANLLTPCIAWIVHELLKCCHHSEYMLTEKARLHVLINHFRILIKGFDDLSS